MRSLSTYRDAFFAPIETEFNSFFDRFLNGDSLNNIRSKGYSGYPKMDVLETPTEYIVEMAVPGVDSNDLSVETVPLEGGKSRYLKVSGKMDKAHQYKGDATYHYRELKKSSFVREVTLPDYISGDPVANYERGILKLVWEKPPNIPVSEPKKIPIQIGK